MALNKYRRTTNQNLANMIHATLLERLRIENAVVILLKKGMKETADFKMTELDEVRDESYEIELKLSELTEEMKKRNCVMGLMYNNTTPPMELTNGTSKKYKQR